ncbi:MAG TPA: N-acetylglucosamine kinase, partial [Flavisolibacter sp.]|nr:N-acetylglucosamine kinase [Flavisolibacter sp.]
MSTILLADSGATKAEWCLLQDRKKKTVFTPGINPYFLTTDGIRALLQEELLPQVNNAPVEKIFFYGTGCANPENAKNVKKALQVVFPGAHISVNTDLMAAARALCGTGKGIACILGTGSNSCFYNGKNITR